MNDEWMGDGLCRDPHIRDSVFWPSAGDDGTVRGERLREYEAKSVCHTCPVLLECFQLALAEMHADIDGVSEIELQGVFGATNRWERRWLRLAIQKAAKYDDGSMLEGLVELYEKLGRDGAQAYREALEQTGVSDEELAGRGVEEISSNYAIPTEVAVEWYKKAGIIPERSRQQPWVVRLRQLLSDGEWHLRKEVIHDAAQFVPDAAAHMKAHRRGISVDAARRWYIGDALQTLVKRANCIHPVQQRRNESGDLELRWIGYMETEPKRRRPHRRRHVAPPKNRAY